MTTRSILTVRNSGFLWHFRPVRFGLVGVTGVIVNMSIVAFMDATTDLPVLFTGALAAAVSTFTNFLLNDVVTWRDRRSVAGTKLSRMVRYYVTTAGGSLLYLCVLSVLARMGIRLLLANLLGIAVGGSFNYVIHNLWTWRRRERVW